MRVHEIMTRSVRTIGPDESAGVAWDRMRQDRVHHLVVVRGTRIAGVISDRDLGGEQGAPVRADKRVEELMTRDVKTVGADETVRRAANLLRGNEVGSLPVVDDKDALVGIVTATDFLDMIGRGMEEPPRESDRKTMRDGRALGYR
jgi:CBS domain-containing protein